MITVTLPNVVEPTVEWVPPADQNTAVHYYWATMSMIGDELARQFVDPAVVASIDVAAFCGVNYARELDEHWSV